MPPHFTTSGDKQLLVYICTYNKMVQCLQKQYEKYTNIIQKLKNKGKEQIKKEYLVTALRFTMA